MADKAPLVTQLTSPSEAVAAAADATVIIGRAGFAGTVTEVTYTPEAAITGANTETRTFNLINKGTAGTGSTLVATLAMVSGVNGVAFDEKTITLSATAANLAVADGDILAWTSVHSGSTGLADPGGLVKVALSRS